MTIEEAIKKLEEIKALDSYDFELSHIEADKILLEVIGNKGLTKAYESIERWYA